MSAPGTGARVIVSTTVPDNDQVLTGVAGVGGEGGSGTVGAVGGDGTRDEPLPPQAVATAHQSATSKRV